METIKIFLVDDDKEDQEFFGEALSEIDGCYALEKFNSGADLLNAIAVTHHKPDVIFLDLYMPIVDGEECLESLRSNSKYDTVPIVIYSTEYDIDKIARLFSLGANRYLKKPETFDSLVASLKVSLNSLKRNSLGGNAIINVVA